MTYVLVGALLFVVLYGAAGRRALRRFADWRLASAGLAIGLFAAAGFVGLRGGWGKGLVLAIIAAAFAASARWPRPVSLNRPAPSEMSPSEARSTLGLGPDPSVADVRAAYARLIQRVHPDRGGAPGLAAHLNTARDVLLKGRGAAR